jgi:hypothetical protein
VAVAVAAGGFAIGKQSSSSAAPDQTAAPAPAAQSGHVPKGWSSGAGTIITGADADQAKAAALAAGYQGTVNR